MKKVIALLLCVCLAASCFVGCKKETAPEQVQEKVTFEDQTLVVYTDLVEGDAAHTAYMEQVKKFEEKTGATGDVYCFGAQLDQAYDGAVEAGKTVDVFKISSLNDFRFDIVDTLDLTSYVESTDMAGHAYPAYMDQIRLFSAEGTAVHALPTTADVAGMWYSVAAFEKAGINAPTSMDELDAAFAALKTAGYNPYVLEKQSAKLNFAVHMERVLGEQTLNALVKDGGWAANADAVAAIQRLLDWAGNGYITVVDWPLSWEALGTTAAMTYANWRNFDEYEGLLAQDQKFDCFSYPAAGGSKSCYFDCGALCVSANTAVADLAWDFLYFMTTGEADQMVSAAADTIPCDPANAGGAYGNAVTMLKGVSGRLDHSKLMDANENVDFAEVVLNIYTGAYEDGAEAAAALDDLY